MNLLSMYSLQVRQGVPVAESIIDAHEEGAPDGGAEGGGEGQVRDLRPRPQLQVHLQQPHEGARGHEGRALHLLRRDVLHAAADVAAPQEGARQGVGGDEEAEGLSNRRTPAKGLS